MVLCNENDWSYVHTIVVQGVNKKIYAIKNSLVVDWAVSGEIAGPGYKSYHIFHHPRHRPPHPGSPPPHNWSRGGRRRWSQWSRSQLRRVRGGEKEERLTWHFTSPSLAETGEAELVKVLAITQYSGMRGERVGDKTTLSSSLLITRVSSPGPGKEPPRPDSPTSRSTGLAVSFYFFCTLSTIINHF